MEMQAEPEVIAETDDILVINKPVGLIVHSDGRTKEPSLASWLTEKYPTQAGIGHPWVSPQGESVDVAGIVHRLDRTTSGVVLVAKTKDMFLRLKEMFKKREIEKIYRAFVYGQLEGEGRIVAEIMRSKEVPRRWYARPCEEGDVRAAVTNWRVLHTGTSPEGEPFSYIELRPETGRTHQIRVHLASIGHPIVADHLYAPNSPRILSFTRPALHAHSISLALHGVAHTFLAPLPIDFPKDIV